jgi:maleate isomerase
LIVTARVGLIIPSSNRMVEQEMVAAFPMGVAAHVTRLRMTGANRLAFDQLLPRVEDAARMLTDARCNVVAFHCTANSMDGGKAGEEKILATVERAGAPGATTTITAIQRAFDTLAAHRIVLITPYSAKTTEHEAGFLRQAGYDVLSAKGFALDGSDAYCATPPRFWHDRVIAAAHPDADAYLISCANIAVFAVIGALEARLNRPIVTSNQAVIWDTLRLIGWHSPLHGLGRLLAMRSADEPLHMAPAG